MSKCTGTGCTTCEQAGAEVREVKHALEKAKAWAEGFMFAFYMERGYSTDEALEKAKTPDWDLIPLFANPYEQQPSVEDVDYDTVHITKPDGSCVIENFQNGEEDA